MPDQPDSDEVMRSLLRRSRGVLPVDPARAAAAREAVHAAWLHATAPSRPAWWWAGAAAAIAVVALAYGLWPQRTARSFDTGSASTSLTVASAEFVTGPVQVRVKDAASGLERLLQSGESLSEGAVVSTGPSGRGTVALPDGVKVRFDRETTLRIEADHRIALEAGAVYVDTSSRLASGAPVLVTIRDAVVSDVGTRYEVRLLTDRVRVRVRDGLVQLRRGDVSREAPAATELTMTRTDVRVTPASTFGADWDWIVAAAVAPRIDGRTLAEFLTWVARENGRRVRFEDRALERSTDRTIVYGTIDGLTVDEALDVVLPSCGLAHRVDGAIIVIVAGANTQGAR